MANVYEKAFFGDTIVPLAEAHVSVASSAVLYGLSVYTVFPVCVNEDQLFAFRVADHAKRITNSARIIGIDAEVSEEQLVTAAKKVIEANSITKDVFMRVSIHVTDLVPGVRSRGLSTILSVFAYDAVSILPEQGARLKTSVWRRIPDFSIPSRAKVNGAYVNSVLARQDAIDSGYDDCIFLDVSGHVCELSAANIFIVRDGVLLTPSHASDILEGITRKTVLQIAQDLQIPVQERSIDLTELYVADEVFACGTSAFLTPVIEIDKRTTGSGKIGEFTERLQKIYFDALHGKNPEYIKLLTPLTKN